MFKLCLSSVNSNFFAATSSFIHHAGALRNMSCVTNAVFSSNNILTGSGKAQGNSSFLRTQEVNVMPVRNTKSVKHDPVEAHRVLAADRYYGKPTSCEAVTKRFFRLNWGGWIRTKVGRDYNVHRKRSSRLARSRQHVFCNGQQSYLLDQLAGSWYTRPHYYVDDPYAPYHEREEFLHSRRKPLPPS